MSLPQVGEQNAVEQIQQGAGKNLCHAGQYTIRYGRTAAWRALFSCRPGGNIVFMMIRKFKLARGAAEDVAQRVREGFVPLLSQLPGFRHYYLLDGGPDVLISIRVFDNADEALASNEVAADWMRNNVLEFVKGMPEVTAGNVLIAVDK